MVREKIPPEIIIKITFTVTFQYRINNQKHLYPIPWSWVYALWVIFDIPALVSLALDSVCFCCSQARLRLESSGTVSDKSSSKRQIELKNAHCQSTWFHCRFLIGQYSASGPLTAHETKRFVYISQSAHVLSI